jgi:hypothetical protein
MIFITRRTQPQAITPHAQHASVPLFFRSFFVIESRSGVCELQRIVSLLREQSRRSSGSSLHPTTDQNDAPAASTAVSLLRRGLGTWLG